MFDSGTAALGPLLDNLAARLGREAVSKARGVADWQPERSCRFECALKNQAETSGEELPVFAHRPLRMFRRPIALGAIALAEEGALRRFHYAGRDYAACRCQGPERIETGWWRSAEIRRDYYIVETVEGTRWWIFRRLDDDRWFLHGCFD